MQARLTRLLLAFLLLCAQALLAVHTVDHAIDTGQPQSHACELCIAAQALGTALPVVAAALLLLGTTHVLNAARHVGRSFLPALQPRQQSPPLL